MKCVMSETDMLRKQAAKCFRLALLVSDERSRRKLDAVGRELEQRVVDVERSQDAPHA